MIKKATTMMHFHCKDQVESAIQSFLPVLIFVVLWEFIDWEEISSHVNDTRNGLVLWLWMAATTEFSAIAAGLMSLLLLLWIAITSCRKSKRLDKSESDSVATPTHSNASHKRRNLQSVLNFIRQ